MVIRHLTKFLSGLFAKNHPVEENEVEPDYIYITKFGYTFQLYKGELVAEGLSKYEKDIYYGIVVPPTENQIRHEERMNKFVKCDF